LSYWKRYLRVKESLPSRWFFFLVYYLDDGLWIIQALHFFFFPPFVYYPFLLPIRLWIPSSSKIVLWTVLKGESEIPMHSSAWELFVSIEHETKSSPGNLCPPTPQFSIWMSVCLVNSIHLNFEDLWDILGKLCNCIVRFSKYCNIWRNFVWEITKSASFSVLHFFYWAHLSLLLNTSAAR
jgi:hypothetical protein